MLCPGICSPRLRPVSRVAILLLTVGLAGCGSAEGLYVIDVKSGKSTRVAKTAHVAEGEAVSVPAGIWSQTGPELLAYDEQSLRTITRSGEVRHTVALSGPADGSVVIRGNRFMYVNTEVPSVGNLSSEALDIGDLMIGELTGNRPPRRLLTYASTPHFAPDGQRALAEKGRDKSGRSEPVVVPLTGGAPKPFPRGRRATAWLRDGRVLRQIPGDRDGIVEIATFDKSGRRKPIAEANDNATPLPSPDGRWLAINGVLGGDEFNSLYVVSLAGGQPRRVGPSAIVSSAGWSPDSRRLVATTVDGAVVTLNRDGSNMQPLKRFDHLEARGASWSPDGRAIAVTIIDDPPSD